MKYINTLFALCFLFCETMFGQYDVKLLKYEELGPARGGRVTTVTGVAQRPNEFYLGATGGGIWKTTDYGTSWKNVSDGYLTSPSIGSLCVSPSNPDIIYAGTGTDGLRSNIIPGDGIYKSEDSGKSWRHIGLRKTAFIGSVEVHPNDPNIVYVAAIGNAFDSGEERGVYRSKNGGGDWEKVLYLSDTTGFVDIEIHPADPETIYAAAWRAERKPWTIISGGKENGIYRSTDGGDRWTRINAGLPDIKGKIDLAVSAHSPDILYALVEAADQQSGLYKSIDRGESFTLTSDHKDLLNRAFYYTNVSADPSDANTVYVMGRPFWRSKDSGKTWDKLSAPHGDHHDLWVNPNDPELIIQSNDGGANVSHNGGRTWSSHFNQPTAEIYQVEVDEAYPYWLYGGQQDNYSTVAVPSRPPHSKQVGAIGYIMDAGGCETVPAVPNPVDPDIVYSNCKGRFGVFNKRTGQEQRYDVGAANMYGHNPGDLKYRFQRVSPIHISPHDPSVIYHCSQFVHRTTDEGQNWTTISPDLTANEADKQVISGGPITRDITGEEFYSTIYSIRESPLSKGLIWVGANDGPVHLTSDGGKNWKDVSPPDLLPGARVDCVEPSPHNADKAYISVLRYQLGDFRPYIYKTTDLGASWQLISREDNGFPKECPTRVVREDPNREGLLYVGTDHGMYISMDDGENWQPFQQNLPVTPVTDIKLHRGDLVLSTMGRGFWKIDQLNPLHFDIGVADRDELVKPSAVFNYRNHRLSRNEPLLSTIRYEPPGMAIDFYLNEEEEVPVRLEIHTVHGELINRYVSKLDTTVAHSEWEHDMSTNSFRYRTSSSLKSKKGWQRFKWDLRRLGPWDNDPSDAYSGGAMVQPGTYIISLITKDTTISKEAEVRMNPNLWDNGISVADLAEQEEFLVRLSDLISKTKKMASAIKKQLEESTGSRHDDLSRTHNMLATADGPYPQPKLIDQMDYLYGSLNRAHQRPGHESVKRLKELSDQFREFAEKVGDLDISLEQDE